MRIVQDMDLNEQDSIVDRLRREFPGAKVVDRRTSPTYGYRAVHVIVRIGRCNCEIQVRTSQQHLWAEVVERLADRWGRQIRYGAGPEDPTRSVSSMTRGDFWNAVVRLSDAVHAVEEAAAAQNYWIESGDAPIDADRVNLEETRLGTQRVLADLADFLARGSAL